MLSVDPEAPNRTVLAEAAAWIREGYPVAFPTETVYGLGADALNPAAVQAIFDAKGRPSDNPVIVHLAALEQLPDVVREVPSAATGLMERYWPGPLTLVLPRAPGLPAEVSGGLDTVAVRMPAHPVALALIRVAGRPLAAPSANRSGRPSPTTAAHVLQDLGGKIPLILDGGPVSVGVESTVLDLTGPIPVLLRPGAVTPEEIRAVVGRVEMGSTGDLLRRSPGTRYRHYSPQAETVLIVRPRPELTRKVVEEYVRKENRVGVILRGRGETATSSRLIVEELPDDLAGYARGLFAALRALDDSGVDVIVVEGVEEEGLGLAVMDRLRRAATVVVDDAGEAQRETR